MIDLNSLNTESAVPDFFPESSAPELSILPIFIQNGVAIVAVPELFSEQMRTNISFIPGTKKEKRIPVSCDNIVAARHLPLRSKV
jgi:hypothetical protein